MTAPALVTPSPFPHGWPPRLPPGPSLRQCVLAAVVLHLLLVGLVGTEGGGGAGGGSTGGSGPWSLQVRLLGGAPAPAPASDPAIRSATDDRLSVGAQVPRLPLDDQRSGAAVQQPQPAAAAGLAAQGAVLRGLDSGLPAAPSLADLQSPPAGREASLAPLPAPVAVPAEQSQRPEVLTAPERGLRLPTVRESPASAEAVSAPEPARAGPEAPPGRPAALTEAERPLAPRADEPTRGVADTTRRLSGAPQPASRAVPAAESPASAVARVPAVPGRAPTAAAAEPVPAPPAAAALAASPPADPAPAAPLLAPPAPPVAAPVTVPPPVAAAPVATPAPRVTAPVPPVPPAPALPQAVAVPQVQPLPSPVPSPVPSPAAAPSVAAPVATPASRADAASAVGNPTQPAGAQAPAAESGGRPGRGAADAALRGIVSIPAPPQLPASAPRPALNLELPKAAGAATVRPPPPGAALRLELPPQDARSRLSRDLEKSSRADCRTAHADKGLLAAAALAADALRRDGCKW
jgi:hypothetical protein